MANLGQIGTSTGTTSFNIVAPILFFKTTPIFYTLNRAAPLKVFLKFNSPALLNENISSSSKPISGITRKDGVPGSKIVRLYDRVSGTLVREELSKPDGSFSFENLANDVEFYIVVLDPQPGSAYNAEAVDHL